MRHRNLIANNDQFYDYGGKFLRNELEDYISLAIYTDGAPVSQTSKDTLWPIIAYVVDLPPKLQKSIENVIWIGI
jgi:hypothetical protein